LQKRCESGSYRRRQSVSVLQNSKQHDFKKNGRNNWPKKKRKSLQFKEQGHWQLLKGRKTLRECSWCNSKNKTRKKRGSARNIYWKLKDNYKKP
jgi:hypothetical protein